MIPPRDDDRRARDILSELRPRIEPGRFLSGRLGRRAWCRAPIVGCSTRLFERYDLPDPWSGQGATEGLDLGPVALRLDERRRIPQHGRMPQTSAPRAPDPVTEPGSPASPSSAPPPAPRAAARPSDPKPEAMDGRAIPPPGARHLPPLVAPKGVAVPDSARSGQGARLRLKPTPVTGPRVRFVDPPEAPALVPPPASMDIVPPEAASPGPPEAAPPPVGGAPSGLDDLFGLAASQGRDRRAGGRVTEASEPRKPKVVTSRPDVRKPPGGE